MHQHDFPESTFNDIFDQRLIWQGIKCCIVQSLKEDLHRIFRFVNVIPLGNTLGFPKRYNNH
jgi:hypothetical protein